MENICVIPARGGSKRIKRKNIIDFLGKPLISYAISYALKAGIFDAVYVSTDDEEIAEIAHKYGASVLKRPKDLADDFSDTDAVMRDVLMNNDAKMLCCLYATAVLIDEGILRAAFEEYRALKAGFLLAAGEFSYPIQRAFYLDEKGSVKMFDESKYFVRSQDLVKAYQDAGAFYFASREVWLKNEPLYREDARIFLLKRSLICDIDSYEDLEFAKKLYEIKLKL